MTSPSHTSSTRQKGHENRNKTLELLGRLGYATTRQIAKGVWGEVTPSTRKMASKIINALLKLRLIVERRDDVNLEKMVALTRSGVARLDYPMMADKVHARDYLRHAHSHRTAANSVFVAAASYAKNLDGNPDWLGYTELEIRLDNRVEIKRAWCDYTYEKPTTKIADGLIFIEGRWVWIEVENAYRSTTDFKKCCEWLRTLFSQNTPLVDAVWFISTRPGANRIGDRLKVAFTPSSFENDARPRREKELDTRILAQRIKVFELDEETLTLSALARAAHPNQPR